MNNFYVVLLMIFCHIVDDYYLQGWLASAKQEKWWQENAPDTMYKNDYIWALLMHSFSWAFMMMLPIAFVNGFNINPTFLIVFMTNISVHAITDDMKANKRMINLWVDQGVHMCQIAITALILLH